MHILSQRNRSEFLAVPQLVRFNLADGEKGLEPTLLLKTSSLIIKYLLTKKTFRILFAPLDGGYLGYGVEVDDDCDHPALIWSLVAYDDELDALKMLVSERKCIVHVFNELVIDVSWCEIDLKLSQGGLGDIIKNTRKTSSEFNNISTQMHDIMEGLFYKRVQPPAGYAFNCLPNNKWHELKTFYVTNQFESTEVGMFGKEEGSQQEILALWLIDNLDPKGALKGPNVYEPNKPPRELSDLFLTYENGSFLVESKTLSIFNRPNLPNRKKLISDIAKRIRTATSQLGGGLKNLRRGCPVKDKQGNEIEIERTKASHSIVLIPDIELIQTLHEFGGNFITNFLRDHHSFLHFLDLAELLRIVQASEMISEDSASVSKIMAFDYYLMERFDRAIKNESPAMHILFRRK